IESLAAEFETLVSSLDKQNAAQSLQGIGALVCAATAVAALSTDFSTRDAVGDVIDSLVDLYATYQAGIDTAYGALTGGIGKQFIPDHDTLSELYGIFTATNQLLIDRAFDLKTKRVMRLTAPNDAITLTWELYGDIGKLPYFLATNHIVDDEFNEIPAGREIVAYV
ncbi:MAG: hypothetical protein IMZ69_11470, partial [Spirochaetes bacterium]|nr:hypothetical protein [Spirochaetota bacterium]